MNAELKKLLAQLSEEELSVALQLVYGMDKSVDRRIESLLLASDTDAHAKHLKKRVASLKRGSRFISWSESSAFARDMERLLDEISALVPTDPQAAFKLADAFMATHEKVLSRCDDSNGSIGGAYYYALELWINAAVAWESSNVPCKVDWPTEIAKRHQDNAYGMWDRLISGSKALLSPAQLYQMAEQFEEDAVRFSTQNDDSRFCSKTTVATLGISGVAEALGDVELYARSYTCTGKHPNELQSQDIAKFALAQDDGESALQWLSGNCEHRFQLDKNKLLDEAYSKLGRTEDLLHLRRAAYESDPSVMRLNSLIEVSPLKEHKALTQAAALKAYAIDDIRLAVNALFNLKESGLASDYLKEFPERLEQVWYEPLLDWTKKFEDEEQYLAAVLCYRHLMLDILRRAKTKSYPHAAKYYRALSRLDKSVGDYGEFVDAADFEQQLQDKHGKKYSFWDRVS